MSLGRRTFMKMFATAPIAGREAAQQITSDLARMTNQAGSNRPLESLRDTMTRENLYSDGVGQGNVNEVPKVLSQEAQRNWIMQVLARPQERAEIESILYQLHRNVYRIDPDIGCMKSWSFNAKHAFMRQRVVQREIEETVARKTLHQQMIGWREKALNLFGLSSIY